jgi:Zn-dependent peptidase ImmA (M78 family)
MHEVGHALFEPFTGASLDLVYSDNRNDALELRADAFAQECLIPKEVLFHAAQSHGIKWNALTPVGLAHLVADTHVEQKMLVSAALDAGFVEANQQAELNEIDIYRELRDCSDHALTTEEYLAKHEKETSDWIGKRTTMLSPKPIRLPIGYVNAVVDAYRNRQISPGKGAEYLMIEQEEFLKRFGDIYEEVEV